MIRFIFYLNRDQPVVYIVCEGLVINYFSGHSLIPMIRPVNSPGYPVILTILQWRPISIKNTKLTDFGLCTD